MTQKNIDKDWYNRDIFWWEKSYSTTAISVLDYNNSTAEQIAAILDNMSFSLMESLDGKTWEMISVVSNFFGTNPTENPQQNEEICELLKDHHGTFSIFEKWIKEAWKIKNKNSSISIGLYKRDVNNPNFVATLKTAIESGLDPKIIILEIHADDYGLIDCVFIKNLKEAKKLWFSFSIHDFILDGNDIRFSNITTLIKAKIFPKFIKISKVNCPLFSRM